MTIRNVTKNFAGMEDLLTGVGKTDQVRNETTVSMGGVDVPYAVNTVAEMQALDVTRFTSARVYSSTTEFIDYRYDSTDVTGILPVSGSGSWLLAQLSSQSIESLELTLTEAIESTKLYENAVLSISDRAYGIFDVVLASSVTPNTFDIVQCTGVPTLALVLRSSDGINVREIGATTSNDLSIYLTAAQAAGHSVIKVPEIKGGSYQASSVFATTAPIIIDMRGAKINVTHNNDFIRLQHSESQTIGGELVGTGKADGTKPLQAGIRVYPNTINCVISKPILKDFAGDVLAGAIVATDTVLNHQGNRVITPTITNCNVGLNLGNKAEYFDIVGGGINLCNVGVRWEGGNNVMTGVAISDNVVGVDVVAGSNDSHGSLNACQINHNTTPFRIGAISTKQFEFNNCHIFFGTGELNGCQGVVFKGGEMGNLIINEDGCRNCYVIGVNVGAGGLSPVPNFGGNDSEVFYLDMIHPITTSALTSARLNGLRVFADNSGTSTVATGRNQYIYPRVSQQIPYNAAYTVQPVYSAITGNFSAAEVKIRGGFEIPVDIRLSLSRTVAWNPSDANVYLEDLDTGARIAELMPQTLFVSGSNNIYTYQFSGIVPKANLGLFVENNTGAVLDTFSDQTSSIRSYWLSTLQ